MSNLIEPAIYQAIVVKAALTMYAKYGMRANRAYTPKRMIETAARITGKPLKLRDYFGAANALQSWIDERNAR